MPLIFIEKASKGIPRKLKQSTDASLAFAGIEHLGIVHRTYFAMVEGGGYIAQSPWWQKKGEGVKSWYIYVHYMPSV